MTERDAWEQVGRETLSRALSCLLEDAEAIVEPVADTVYWDHDVSAEEVEAMRQLVFDLEYVTEAYLARLCDETESWEDDDERAPSRLPGVGTETGEASRDGKSLGTRNENPTRDRDEEVQSEAEE